MPQGSGSTKRSRALAARAYMLHRQGMTTRQIADLVGTKVEAVPDMVRRGERFADEFAWARPALNRWS
jgi:hypothetical protein